MIADFVNCITLYFVYEIIIRIKNIRLHPRALPSLRSMYTFLTLYVLIYGFSGIISTYMCRSVIIVMGLIIYRDVILR